MLRQTHQRNPLLSVLTVLLLAALACGGSGRPGPEDSIVGKWQREDGKETIEFFDDGRVIINILSLDITWTGKFKFVDEDTLQIDVAVLDETVSSVFDFSLAEDALTLTSEDGISATYERVK